MKNVLMFTKLIILSYIVVMFSYKAKLIDKDVNKSKVILESTIKILREGMDSIRLTLRNIKQPVEVIVSE